MKTWKDLKEKIINTFPRYKDGLNSPANEADIQEIEKMASVSLPESYFSIYRECDGEKNNQVGFLFGLSLLPLESVKDEMTTMYEIIEDGLDGLDDFCESKVEGFIKHDYLNKKWIPIFADWGGNYIGLDFDPGPNGTIGQVINFGRDEDIKYVLASSLENLIDKLFNLIDEQDVNVNSDGEYNYKDLHFIDALKTIA